MDERQLVRLGSEECRGLLASQEVGRLGVVRGGYPVIVPVNYALHGDKVIVRTDAGGKFLAARQNRVSFQIDHFDPSQKTGWSVLVQGFGAEVTPDDPRYVEFAALPERPWAHGDRSRLLVITPTTITGRRISGRPDIRHP